MTQNIIVVNRNKKSLNRDRNGYAVVKINPRAADIVEDFVNQSNVSICELVSSMINFASDYTMVREAGHE